MEVVHHRPQAIARFRERGGRMHHRLFVAAKVVREIRVLLQSLSDSSYIAVAEDAETSREERILGSVARYVLDLQKLDDGLRHRQSSRHGFTGSG